MKVMHIDEETALAIARNLPEDYEDAEEPEIIRKFIVEFCKTFTYVNRGDGKFIQPC